jgi:hypothetical protein
MRAVAIASLVALGACGGAAIRGPGPLRFRNEPPVTVVNDRVPIPAPKEDELGLVEYYFREDVLRPARRVLRIDATLPAANVNSLGQVPDSAWFTNRRPTPDEVRRGPAGGEPDRSGPWKVVGVKVGGASIGLTIEDARGDKFIIKFDERGHPEAESAADVIVQRLTWAFGYNVPANEVVTFRREDLVLDAKAVMKTKSGHERPMTEQDLEMYLGMIESDRGSFRALASRFIDGTIIGGVEPEGVRDDDPNDRVRHELRRDLRGQRVLWAWVNHWDLKPQNTLATYTDDKHVEWYQLDFGESFGVGARIGGPPRNGYRKMFSLRRAALSLVSFGTYVFPWEKRGRFPKLRGLGHFDSKTFDFAGWVPAHNWRPTDVADKLDEFWGAEILMRLTPAHIAAAVDAGRYSDPRTAAYLTETLIERQRKIGEHVFAQVAPLVDFSVEENAGALEVCFDDLWLVYDYGDLAATSYRARTYDYAGALVERTVRRSAASGPRTCVAGLAPGATHDRYTIVELVVRRPKQDHRIYVHVAVGPAGFRVIGLDRR